MANHRPDGETMGKSAFLNVTGGGGEACAKEISLETSRSWRLRRPGGCRFLVSRVLFRQKGSSLFFLNAGGEIPKRSVLPHQQNPSPGWSRRHGGGSAPCRASRIRLLSSVPLARLHTFPYTYSFLHPFQPLWPKRKQIWEVRENSYRGAGCEQETWGPAEESGRM